MNKIKLEEWEFSGNLKRDNGIINYDVFKETVNKVMKEFHLVFTPLTMMKYPLLIDNATSGSGPTPIITPILNKYLIIKLGITDGLEVGQTVFQLAHELTHLVFFSYLGLDKTRADDYEEGLCSAVSLAFVLKFNPNDLQRFSNSLLNSDYVGYQSGFQIAIDHGFSIESLKNTILKEIDKRKQQA